VSGVPNIVDHQQAVPIAQFLAELKRGVFFGHKSGTIAGQGRIYRGQAVD